MSDTGKILDEIKKVLGVEPDYDIYDTDIIMFANAAFGTLHQLGVGPDRAFVLIDKNQTWDQFMLTEDIMSAKTYVWTTVRLAFDPPTNSFGITALETLKKELEWRLNVAKDRSNP